jgi:hypothetical protein
VIGAGRLWRSQRDPAGPIPGGSLPPTAFAVWLENGERVTDEPTRAPILCKARSSGDPKVQVRSVMKQLQSIFPYTRAVCFENQGNR